MISPSKTYKRLGIVGAAAVVGLVPISILAAAAPAFAVTPGSASLTITPETPSAASVSVNSFTTSVAFAAGDQITITSQAASGTAETLPASGYSVTYGASNTVDPVTAVTVNAGPPQSAVLTVQNAIPASTAVTVNIVGTTNPANGVVYFTDATNSVGDTTSANTNSITIAGTTGTPAVSSVNPTAFTVAGGEPFTIMGSGFNTAAPLPTICFVPKTTTTIASTCATTTGGVPGNAITGTSTATEIQSTAPALTTGTSYNVVVYDGTTPSVVSSQTLVSALAGLNFVPESGIRVVDSRSGIVLPKGALTPGVPYTIPVTAFDNSYASPTNLAPGATALSLNVTAVAPASGGNLQVWSSAACGTPPLASTVNFQPPQDTSNSTVVDATAGNICVQDNGAPVSVVMDLTGYTNAGGFTAPVATPRVLDTRNGTGGLFGPLSSGNVYRFNPGLGDNMPVVLNVTAVAPTSVGNLRVFPEPATGPVATSAVPNTSVLTYIPNTDASSMYVTTTGPTGYVDIYSAGTGTVNVVMDEVANLTGSNLKPVSAPFRIYDSRPGGIAAGGTVNVTAVPSGTLTNNVPATALGVVGDIGDINPAAQGNLRTFPAGGAVPATSTINNFPMQTRSTSGVVAVNPSNGEFSIYSAGSATNATFDVTGYIG